MSSESMFRRGLVAAVLAASVACGSQRTDELTPDAAAAALRASKTFTSRPGSVVGRELIEIVAVRRIGRSSTEVEFTWRDTAPPAGQSAAAPKTSMALFRLQDGAVWALSSLYKID